MYGTYDYGTPFAQSYKASRQQSRHIPPLRLRASHSHTGRRDQSPLAAPVRTNARHRLSALGLGPSHASDASANENGECEKWLLSGQRTGKGCGGQKLAMASIVCRADRGQCCRPSYTTFSKRFPRAPVHARLRAGMEGGGGMKCL